MGASLRPSKGLVMKKRIILLTGVPSSGKTTATEYIKANFTKAKVIRYGEFLFKIKKKEYPNLTYKQMRSLSASIIRKEDIAKIDSLILSIVNNNKEKHDIIIESHGVTKEKYGFRVTPYRSFKKLNNLGVDTVVYISSDTRSILKRMRSSSNGRKRVSQIQIQQNLRLQENLALAYSVLTGSTFFVIENNGSEVSFKKKIDLVFNQILK